MVAVLQRAGLRWLERPCLHCYSHWLENILHLIAQGQLRLINPIWGICIDKTDSLYHLHFYSTSVCNCFHSVLLHSKICIFVSYLYSLTSFYILYILFVNNCLCIPTSLQIEGKRNNFSGLNVAWSMDWWSDFF